MNILFIANPNLNRGSYRIWINDLNYYLINIDNNINSKILDFNKILKSEFKLDNILNYNIIIFDKSLSHSNIINQIKSFIYKNKNQSVKLGLINPNSEPNKNYKYIDFFITGSVEEKDTLIKFNKNIFIFPLIEKQFYNLPNNLLKFNQIKTNINQNTLTLGYHGNPYHLNHFEPNIKNAINRLDNYIKSNNLPLKLKLLVITNSDNPVEWIIGKPNIPIELKKYNLNSIKNDLLRIDIGLVPNISEFYNNNLKENTILGKYKTDIMIRMKNKSNNGRSLVFHQLGIPVIADYTPSNLHILGNPNNGYAVCSEEGYYQAFLDLLEPIKRNEIGQNGYKECQRLYNPINHTKSLKTYLTNLI